MFQSKEGLKEFDPLLIFTFFPTISYFELGLK